MKNLEVSKELEEKTVKEIEEMINIQEKMKTVNIDQLPISLKLELIKAVAEFKIAGEELKMANDKFIKALTHHNDIMKQAIVFDAVGKQQ